MPAPILSVSDLSISFRSRKEWHRAVSGVSFSVQKGETLSLVGESGCGKSVTALSLLRLLPEPPARIDEGAIHYKGENILKAPLKNMRRLRGKEIAMIFQEPATSLNPVFTVGDQIAEAVRIHERINGSEAKARALDAMERVGIPAARERYDDYPHQMSGGMKQRIMIAMALVCKPAVLIADEPTTALDVTIQAQILDLIEKIQTENDMGVILITHDLGVVAEVADRVVVMYAGTVVEMADVGALFAKPLHPYTAALYRSIPTAAVASSNTRRLQSIPGRVPSPSQIPPYCRFYDRCSLASDECKKGEPELREVEPGHFVRCIKV